MFKMESVNL